MLDKLADPLRLGFVSTFFFSSQPVQLQMLVRKLKFDMIPSNKLLYNKCTNQTVHADLCLLKLFFTNTRRGVYSRRGQNGN